MTPTLRHMLSAVVVCSAFAITGAAAQENYAGYRVLSTKVVEDMWAGPGQRAALLSPDGSRLLHLGHRKPDMCLYAPAQIGSWVELACADYTDDNRPGAAQDMFWSPAGDKLLMPTRQDALAAFRDTDIRIFDAETFTVRNLTDDGLSGSFIKGNGPVQIDVLAHWGGKNSVFFVRLSRSAGEPPQKMSTKLMSVAIDGGEAKALVEVASGSNVPVLNFTVSADAKLLAYSLEDKSDAERDGIYVMTVGATVPTLVAKRSDLVGMRLSGLAFSADRKYLLLLGIEKNGHNAAQVLDLDTSDIFPVDAKQNVTGVAWSPTGSALAYTTNDKSKPEMPGGLFLAPAPGKQARLLIGGGFYPPVCCGNEPMIWATNDTLVLSQLGNKLGSVLYIRLGE